MINAVIVGMGRWGQFLVEAVQGKSDKIQFVGGRTRTTSESASAFAEKHGFSLTNSYEELLARDDVDAVVLASPHSTHAEQVQLAAKAGKHVLCEKPFTLDRASAEQSVKACRDAGVVLGVAHNRRFYPAYTDLQDMVRSGKLGEILHMEGNFSNPSGYDLKEGVWRVAPGESTLGGMAAKGVHMIDAMVGLAGPAQRVHAVSTRKALTVADDTTAMLLWFGKGTSGYAASLEATAYIWRLAVFGSKGWAEMRGQHNLVIRMNEDGEFGEVVKTYQMIDTLRLEQEAFADAINGGAPYPMTDEEIIATPALWEAAIRSAESGDTADI
ncbi:MAG: Gfo/Idh/MocA family oxidoreductase [Rhodospirillaceae bacterium]|jgi:predicted dehydrogenase|nr:Gfo/Idh/MocA family oxidoreductase [Rhodospirillales bacterium]MBT3907882.1 Gfo/Idh/MocA family oxidoreductase [Rhodospirillaceae bacterium]MBT4703302.1 Gfo/Idh/MocA family oxidoreductase [Rhodospirillaceae bacterium]MBT5035683.1 Gfo/Idh/MocA family oxidoreductase [Rhodospirillaceae bacterium]MBT6218686.1 Gfo/Idh/MocA family oxidoreductase [Rhodospirillaceae bacterium]